MEDRLTKWLAHYKGETPESKDVMSRTKKTYKGDPYLPWANMLGVLYRLDPDASVEKVMNSDGGYVFTDLCTFETKSEYSKEGKDETKYSFQTALSHSVKVRITYLGKVYEEVYPIQDNAYGAVTRYDSNMVNKALQRCMSRTISLATGIGWGLYEQGEAGQFEEDGTIQPTPTETVVETTPTPTEDGRAFSIAEQVANLILNNRDNDAMKTLVDNYNTVLSKKYNFNDAPLVLSFDDDEPTLVKKLEVVANLEKIWKGVSKVAK